MLRKRKSAVLALPAALAISIFSPGRAWGIDFYEIQIYGVDTTPKGRLQAELHSNGVTSADGPAARQTLNPYQLHETLEMTYGVSEHSEVGQYIASAVQHGGPWEYAGARTKFHFGLTDAEKSFIGIGGNVELDYMRRDFEDNPLSLELRPILEKRIGRFDATVNAPFSKPFNGRTPLGMQFGPSGLVSYDLVPQLTPALEYYGDMGTLLHMPRAAAQQHFLLPAINVHLMSQLEINLGVGFGLTEASRGVIVKSILGWTF